MNIEEDGKTYIKIKDRQEKSIVEKNKVLEKLSKLEPLENEEYPIEELLEETLKENKQLKEDKKKAIELIRKAIVETDITGNGTLNLNELLEILGDKE